MPQKQTDFAGRVAYLRATEQLWKPSTLESLREAAPPVVAWLRPRYDMTVLYPEAPSSSRRIFRMMLNMGLQWPRWSELDAPEAPRAALMHWRSQYPIAEADTWIMDAALHTILECWLAKLPLRWTYAPDQPWPALFRPQCVARWRGHDDGEQKRIEKDLVNRVRRQWRAYCSQVKAEIAARKTNLDRDARWAARRQNGESSQQIALSTTRFDEGTVRIAVRSFARRIGLTLSAN